ncbi:MMPL family transporter [Nocardia alba]|uniref:RND superfamily putative drug exporter n=1 Tax=Nocardia alba TaxID=225051 RepID=A0A4R1FL55_9NOCA|nr:MMPL family transporter [Nocardia alba]TCJ95213.1 RND superfamily putative drug exporter [Nocardia alba]
MFEFTRRRSRWVLGVFVVLAVVLGALGATLFERVEGGGYTDSGSESHRALEVLRTEFGQAPPNLVLLVETESSVEDPESTAAATALVANLQERAGVAEVRSYWTSHQPALRSVDGKQGLIVASVLGSESEIDERVTAISRELTGEQGSLQVRAGGFAMLMHETVQQSKTDIAKGEAIAFPLTLIALLFVFGGLVAASLPLLVAIGTVLTTMGALWLLTLFMPLSVTATNVATLLGLGLAIDYSLLIVNRYRDELSDGRTPAGAVATTLRTAGRTVAFSALTVAVALAGLLFFPLLAIRSMGYAGIVVAALAALVSLTALPAALLLIGTRIDKGQLGWWFLRAPRPAPGEGAWHRLATTVMRKPISIGLAVTALLLLLGAPFLGVKLGFPDERTLPESMNSRQVTEIVARDFGESDQHTLVAVLPESAYSAAGLDTIARDMSDLDNVRRVDTATGSYAQGGLLLEPTAANARFRVEKAVYLSIVPSTGDSDALAALVEQVRAVRTPSELLVGGVAAANADSVAAIENALPWALGFVVIMMLIVLFALTGSVVLPVLAVILSALSLTATFGALVWIFQDGHLSGVLGFTVTGDLSATVPVMLFAAAFGLAMDYQVFLLSRIREEYDRTGKNETAVALGLERVGRIVTAAAILISLVFLGFLASDITFMKAFGIGLPLAVIVDATLVRGFLLPAAMKVLGDANWYAPEFLRRLHDRWGLDEGGSARSKQQVVVRDPLAARVEEIVVVDPLARAEAARAEAARAEVERADSARTQDGAREKSRPKESVSASTGSGESSD